VLEYELYIVRSSTNLISEIGQYRFKEDVNGNATNEPISEHDHALDAMRYIVRHLSEGQKGLLAFG
jgi:phage terminase large subunit